MKRWYHWAGFVTDVKLGVLTGILLVLLCGVLDGWDSTPGSIVRVVLSVAAIVAFVWAFFVKEWD